MTEHKNIYMALAAAQAEMSDPKKNGNNKHFGSKYPTLNDVIQAARPTLSKHGMTYFWTTDPSGDRVLETTHIYHGASETFVTSPVPLIIAAQNMQGFKSAQTYARRMGLAGLCGLEGDEDDDGNAAAKNAPKGKGRENPKAENPISEGLKDAWKDSVLDRLPPNASGQEKAEAFAEALIAEYANKGERALDAAWERRKPVTDWLEAKYPEIYERVVDAYLSRQNEIQDAKRESIPAE